MFTELIDTLRCPNPHADSWLVATSTRTGQRHIIEGSLGCPTCRSTFAIQDAEVLFADGPVLRSAITLDDDGAFRIAAQLHLLEDAAPVLLMGQWSRAVAPLRRILPTVTMFVGNATTAIPLDERVSLLRLPATAIPVATGALRGVALDAAHTTPALLEAAARVTRTRGRLVVPAGTTLDGDAWTVLASDDQQVVAERRPVASQPVPLRRAPARPLFE